MCCGCFVIVAVWNPSFRSFSGAPHFSWIASWAAIAIYSPARRFWLRGECSAKQKIIFEMRNS